MSPGKAPELDIILTHEDIQLYLKRKKTLSDNNKTKRAKISNDNALEYRRKTVPSISSASPCPGALLFNASCNGCVSFLRMIIERKKQEDQKICSKMIDIFLYHIQMETMESDCYNNQNISSQVRDRAEYATKLHEAVGSCADGQSSIVSERKDTSPGTNTSNTPNEQFPTSDRHTLDGIREEPSDQVTEESQENEDTNSINYTNEKKQENNIQDSIIEAMFPFKNILNDWPLQRDQLTIIKMHFDCAREAIVKRLCHLLTDQSHDPTLCLIIPTQLQAKLDAYKAAQALELAKQEQEKEQENEQKQEKEDKSKEQDKNTSRGISNPIDLSTEASSPEDVAPDITPRTPQNKAPLEQNNIKQKACAKKFKRIRSELTDNHKGRKASTKVSSAKMNDQLANQKQNCEVLQDHDSKDLSQDKQTKAIDKSHEFNLIVPFTTLGQLSLTDARYFMMVHADELQDLGNKCIESAQQELNQAMKAIQGVGYDTLACDDWVIGSMRDLGLAPALSRRR